jgi:hypothetical protein
VTRVAAIDTPAAASASERSSDGLRNTDLLPSLPSGAMHLDAKSIGWEREQCALEECCDVLTTLCEPLMSLRIPCQRRL